MISEQELLGNLLSRRPRRGMRCDSCRYYNPDPVWEGEGYCREIEDHTLSGDGCVYWWASEHSQLDYMGIPKASPLAQKDDQ